MQEKQRAFLVRTAYWAVWAVLLWLGVRYLLRWLLPFLLALALAALGGALAGYVGGTVFSRLESRKKAPAAYADPLADDEEILDA